MAENFSKHPQKRSIVFLATAAEEMGLLGAKYYVKNPVIPLEKTIVGVNMDMLNFLGIKDSIELTPVANTDAVETIKEIARKNSYNLILSDYDNRFGNFRKDSYSFCLHDVVTFNINNAQIKGNYLSLSDSDIEKIVESGGFNIHTPLDEIKPWFRYDGILQELELAWDIGIHYATDGPKPKLNEHNPFAPAKLLWNK